MEQLGDIPDNFIVGNYLPQLDILRQADVFISHCGMNSTSESLYGAGFMLNIQQLLAEDLKHAVNEVLQHSIYKENAKKISQSFREAGGYIKAVDEIVTFTR
ncbi:glycosyl transferase [Bacillus thuringiensis]|nr:MULTISPECIES: glycosyl transferase [Bacillus]MCR6814598.1 glycosyl transferase [Bacillus thuringiensis]MED2091880.1 glycosyl transferase [Bacillus thuringiensis]MED2129051.1 glycosyl transferase [Bacillus thuringiensis]MED2955215.1 glycosyl transferase [Bacillus thuringiensis]MED3192084.1 glycosyl transferase [Bacillus thuringiensis]